MIESTCWHPVADAASPGDAPLAVTLLGNDLVLWRDGAGGWHAFADRCPHRGTRLSLGRLCDGRLECAYHGWQFSGSGDCMRIPALAQFWPPASHRATAHPVALACGLVWVRLAESGDAAPPPFEAEADPRLRKLLVGPYDVAASAPRIVENFLDSEVSYRYELTAPYSATLTKLPQAQDGYFDVIALFVCPMQEERSRVWFRMAVTDFDSSDAELRAFQHGIFLQDQPVLESQVPKRLPLHGEVHSAADRSSAAYRRFLRERGITFGVC